jgi:hypothetical protein
MTTTCVMQVKTIVMINCGALVELRSMLELSSEQRCYVFDCHRPFHHTNVHSLDQVGAARPHVHVTVCCSGWSHAIVPCPRPPPLFAGVKCAGERACPHAVPAVQITVVDDGSLALDSVPEDGDERFQLSSDSEEEEEEEVEEEEEEGAGSDEEEFGSDGSLTDPEGEEGEEGQPRRHKKKQRVSEEGEDGEVVGEDGAETGAGAGEGGEEGDGGEGGTDAQGGSRKRRRSRPSPKKKQRAQRLKSPQSEYVLWLHLGRCCRYLSALLVPMPV